MASKLILLNDVGSDFDQDGLIPAMDTPISKEGEEQAGKIAEYVAKEVKEIDSIAASDMERINKLVHQMRVRIKSSNNQLASVKRTESLRERNFGVLAGTTYSLESDLFNHTRICAEGGESVAQARDRAVNFVNSYCARNLRYIIVSHPFLCQIVSNVFLSKNHTTLTSFWFQKGSFIVFSSTKGNYGLTRKFDSAYNAVLDRRYSLEEIYSGLLGSEGTPAG